MWDETLATHAHNVQSIFLIQSTEVPKLKTCIKKHYSEKCFDPLVDNALLENLTNGVLSVTKGRRMFCNAVKITDRSAALRDITPCESDFYEKAEDCVKEFRGKFLANRNDSSLCRLVNIDHCVLRI